MSGNILVTGADKGLGFAFVEACLEKGYNVFACLYQEAGPAMQGLKSRNDGRLNLISMDVSCDESVNLAVKEFSSQADSVEMIINNAGVHFDVSFNVLEEVNFDTAIKTFNINSLGPLRVTKGFIPFLRKGRVKTLVNISSEAGSISTCWREKEYDYCMSKASVNMQSMLLQRYLKKDGIKVLAVHPGWLRTDMGGMEADVEPATSARGILSLVDKYKGDVEGPIYMDYTGKLFNW